MRRIAIIGAALALSVATTSPAAETLTVSVTEPSGVRRSAWPVTSGVPLAKGALTDAAAVALFSPDGVETPLQTEALARWPDGSVRWLLLDFQTDLRAHQRKTFVLRFGPDVRRDAIDKPLVVTQQPDDRIRVDTGPMRLTVPVEPSESALRTDVQVDTDGDGAFSPAERIAKPGGFLRAVIRDQHNVLYSSDVPAPEPLTVSVEQAGPLRACVRVDGRHASSEGGQMFRYVLRIHAFRGQPSLKYQFTFINDRQDALMTKIESLELHFECNPGDSPIRHVVQNGRAGETRRVLQVEDDRYLLDDEPADKRAAGWAAVAGARAGFAVGLREFWQHWPKSVGCRDNALVVGICPQFPAGLYDGRPLEQENKLYYQLRGGGHTFKVGLAKTHELWATFFAGKPDVEQLAAFFQAAEDPLLATCQPTYVSATKAAGEFPPADEAKFAGYDGWLSRAIDAHLRRREQAREYGMLNYGDWYGERQVNWGNLEYDLAHGLFLQYLRTGDRRFFLRAEQAARHHIDVDTVHAVNPHLKNPWGPPPQVGEIWLHCLCHTGGYYQDAPLPVSRTYQMGHSTNFGHVWIGGDLDYYYLTGDRRARDVAVQMADAMVRHMPTRYGTHIRALGWPMILVLDAYQATGDPKYLKAATQNWLVLKENIDWQRGWVVRLAKGHCLHEDRRCEGNVPFMEGLTMCALARYHRIMQDPEVLRAIGVGIDQMIRECWQADAKTFSYTACPLSSRTPYVLFLLSAEAMAYEAALTGNREHLQILREGLRAAIPTGDGQNAGKGLAQMIYFTPHGLSALEEE